MFLATPAVAQAPNPFLANSTPPPPSTQGQAGNVQTGVMQPSLPPAQVPDTRYPTLPPAPAGFTLDAYEAANPANRTHRDTIEALQRQIEILRLQSQVNRLRKEIRADEPPPPPPPPPPVVQAPPPPQPAMAVKPLPPPEAPLPTILAIRGSGSRMVANLRLPEGGERVVVKGARIDPETVVASISEAGVTVLRKGQNRNLTLDGSAPQGSFTPPPMPPTMPQGAPSVQGGPAAAILMPQALMPQGIVPPAMMQPGS
jgi:type IV pilus biogenesis protein PilP